MQPALPRAVLDEIGLGKKRTVGEQSGACEEEGASSKDVSHLLDRCFQVRERSSLYAPPRRSAARPRRSCLMELNPESAQKSS